MSAEFLYRKNRPLVFEEATETQVVGCFVGDSALIVYDRSGSFTGATDDASLSSGVDVGAANTGVVRGLLSESTDSATLSASAIVSDVSDLFFGRESRFSAYPKAFQQTAFPKRNKFPPSAEDEPPPVVTGTGSLNVTAGEAGLEASVWIGEPLPPISAEMSAALEGATLDATTIPLPRSPSYIGSGKEVDSAAEDDELRKIREYWETREAEQTRDKMLDLIEIIVAIDAADEAQWREDLFGSNSETGG